MFDQEKPALSYKFVKQKTLVALRVSLLRDVDPSSSEHLQWCEKITPIIRHKVDGNHQLIGRWVLM